MPLSSLRRLLIVGCAVAATGVSAAAQPGIVINEFMAQNTKTIADEAGGFDDWVEFHNPGAAPVNLGGYHITDNLNRPTKYRLPDTDPARTTIPAGGYLLLWFDEQPEQGVRHVPLRLSSQGDQIGLFAPDGVTPVDTLTFGLQSADVSYGRSIANPAVWVFYTQPTPGARNTSSGSGIRPDVPRFSHAGGFYTAPFDLTITGPAGTTVFYTLLRGEQADPAPKRYTAPVRIDKTTAVRAWAEGSGGSRSPVEVNTFIFNNQSTLPVISLVTPPSNLWDWNTGIYVRGPNADTTTVWLTGANFWKDWTKPGHVELFEPDGALGFELDLGMKIFGGRSRLDPKKSFKVDLDPQYGQSRVSYPVVDEHPTQTYDTIIFRASTQDWWRVRNELPYQVNKRAGKYVDYQNYRPAILYLNGAYWGMYNMMEGKGNEYFKAHHGVDDYDLLWGLTGKVVEGDANEWNATLAWLNSPAYLNAGLNDIAKRFDLNSLFDYWAIHFFAQESLTGNSRWWRPRKKDAVWRWMIFDIDSWFKPDIVARATQKENAEAFFLLGRMMKNPAFKQAFVTRTLDLLNTALSPDTVQTLVKSISDVVREEMRRDIDRWGYFYLSPGKKVGQTYADWQFYTGEFFTQYAKDRPGGIRSELRAKYGFGPDRRLTVRREGEGVVQVNTVTPGTLPWTGVYLPDFPVTLKAVAAPGWVFAGWSDPSLPTQNTVSLTLRSDVAVTARFAPAQAAANLAITEINYHDGPLFRPGDWVELYNPHSETVALAGWRFEDDNPDNGFALPAGTTIAPQGRLVLCRNAARFEAVYGMPCVGDFAFGLNNDGDHLRLLDPAGLLADSLTYGDRSPWPDAADGEGPTLSLKAPGLDNTVPGNWTASAALGGTPGAPNTDAPAAPALVVNEINYNSAPDFNPRDWLELFNPTDAAVALGGWRIGAGAADTTALLPDGAVIPAGGYFVACRDSAAFRAAYEGIEIALGRSVACGAPLPFPFDNGGDKLWLLDPNRQVVDSLTYDDAAPWPLSADGGGFTLELRDPTLDNALAASWGASADLGGSPGGLNVPARGGPETSVVINEINYNSSPEFDTKDWIELFNPFTAPLDLGGWRLRSDSNDVTAVLRAGLMIPARGYLVLCRDSVAFETLHGGAAACLAEIGFGFGNGGDHLTLRDGLLRVADSLTYDDAAPWPDTPDGNGPTLELIDPATDNALAAGWAASAETGGTPGRANSAAPPAHPIVLNEINYHSNDNFDSKDWVELLNPNESAVDLTGWRFAAEGEGGEIVFASSAVLPPGGYAVLCRSAADFALVHGETAACLAEIGFGFGDDGDRLALYDGLGRVADSLRYDDEAPWPATADGAGFTLELVDPASDNALAESWTASLLLAGTPGRANGEAGGPTDIAGDGPLPTDIELLANYPNPFDRSTRIGYRLPDPAAVEIAIYNTTGQVVARITPGRQPAGEHRIDWAPDDLGAGLYFYQLIVDGAVRRTRSALLMP